MRISDWSSDVCSSDLLGVRVHTHDIAPALAAIGCYEAREDAVRTVLPGYGERWRFKIAIAGGTQGLINRFRIVAEAPSGDRHEQDMPLDAYLTTVAATNFKQHIRRPTNTSPPQGCTTQAERKKD